MATRETEQIVDETEPAEPLGLRHQYATVNGIRLHYVEQGSGPLVVLLHGFPEFWYSWRHQIPVLAQAGFHVVAPDQRGYNLSEKPHGVAAYSMENLTADVAALIRHLGEEQAIVVGHDWGGGVAWGFAMAYPQLTRRLIVLNCPHPAAMARGLRTPRQLRRSWYMFFFQLPALPELALRAANYRAIERSLRGWAKPGTFTDEDIRAYKEAAARPGALHSEINWYRAAIRGGLRQKSGNVPRILTPTLLIWGEEDRALGKELTYNMERWVPNLTVRYIPRTSHWVQQEQPALVNQYILEFLSDLAPSKPISTQ